MIICTLFTSFGQVFFKLSSRNFEFDIMRLITNYWLYPAFIFYFVGALILVIALKKGELSIVYPMISMSFIWVTLISVFYLNESFALNKIQGMFLIVCGISSIGLGSKK